MSFGAAFQYHTVPDLSTLSSTLEHRETKQFKASFLYSVMEYRVSKELDREYFGICCKYTHSIEKEQSCIKGVYSLLAHQT